MISDLSPKEKKALALSLLRERVPDFTDVLRRYDERLVDYFTDLCSHSEGEDDWHNYYELLCGLKFLRLCATYRKNYDKVRQVLHLREGDWHREGGRWRYDEGGLLLPGTRSLTHYRWMPFQVFVLTSMYGFGAWVDTKVTPDERDVYETERLGEGGTIEDMRRLCTEFTYFAPRKTDKTGLSAYNTFLFFMLEDADCEAYCCANSASQASLLYKRTQDLIRQMDPQERRIRFTAETTNWRSGQPRSAQLTALSAGGKTKDGLYAQLCCADEYGSAPYVKERSDMGSLVNVIESSMGPRREPMTFISTTAGTITAGPFIDKLDGLKKMLERELELQMSPDASDARLADESDRQLCLLLCPDEWETDEETLFTSRNIRRKVNPALGTIVQHSFYDQAIAKSRTDPLKKQETVTKLFNVYSTGRKVDWIKADEIRRLQCGTRIDDCTDEAGWIVFAGCDFSKGDDLNGISYLAVTWDEKGEAHFFADTDVYMSEDAVYNSPIRDMLLRWADEGWLHVVPGKTFDPSVVLGRIMELDGKGVNFAGFGYDRFNAKIVINALSQWLFDIGLDPNQIVLPIQQSYGSYNPVVIEFEYMVRRMKGVEHSPMIGFSSNPMWPWQFGNTMLAVSNDGHENHMPVKGGAPSGKVDSVQMLLCALMLYDMSEGKISK